jgi:small-conductance mechanosensitive channel|tara:strand:- start:3255 stop:3806 length:552 start_codon:yes stop_codon:yes gene_type:complete
MELQTLDYQNILYSPLFSKIIVTIIILIVGVIIGRTIGKILLRILHELGLNRLTKETTKINLSLERIISSFVAYFIYFITLIMALTHLGISTTVLNILIVAIIIIIIIGLVFVVKDFFPNIISGIFIQRKSFIKEGDIIKVNDKTGEVIKINLIETTIKTDKGDIIYIPNSILSKKEITKLHK